MLYEIRGYCAGFKLFVEEVPEEELKDRLETRQQEMLREELVIRFGNGTEQVATELCVDVYEKDTGHWLPKLGGGFKNPKYASLSSFFPNGLSRKEWT